MPGESHKLDSVAHKSGALGMYEKATEPKPNQPNQPKPVGTKADRVGRLIIGEVHKSTVGSPREQIIKLDPKVKKRGMNPDKGRVYEAPTPRTSSGSGVTSGMGGRH